MVKTSHQLTKNNDDRLEIISQAAAGLLWRSESDFPFEVFSWPKKDRETIAPQNLLARIDLPPTTPVKTSQIEDFFAPAIRDRDWHDEDDRKIVQKYRNLLATIAQNLSNTKVYLVDEVEIKIYIIGELSDRDWGVLFTKAIET